MSSLNEPPRCAKIAKADAAAPAPQLRNLGRLLGRMHRERVLGEGLP